MTTNSELKILLWEEERNADIESLYGDFGKRSSELNRRLDACRPPPYTETMAQTDRLKLSVMKSSLAKDKGIKIDMFIAMFVGMRYTFLLSFFALWGLW